MLVEIELKKGTTKKLQAIGVSDGTSKVNTAFGKMPSVTGLNWKPTNAFFKLEGKQINIGLGNGKALEIFNNNVKSINLLRK